MNEASFGLSREQLVALLKKDTGYVLRKLALLVGLWVLLAWGILHTDLIIGKVFLWALLGFVINGLVQLSHETWHNNLFPRPWQNILLGNILSLVVGIAYEPLKHDHLMHHKFNRTDKDPDAFNAGRRSWLLLLRFYSIVFLGLILSLLYFNIFYPIQHFSRRKLIRHLFVLLTYACFYILLWSCLSSYNLTSAAWQVWLIPVLFTSPYNGLKSISDHHANDWEGNRYRTATTVQSNRFVTYFWNGLNYHLDHHLFPRVPGYNLPALHEHLSPHLKERKAPVFKSYLKVMLAALYAGPTIVDQDIKLATFQRKRQN